MTFTEFYEENNGAPIELDELATRALSLTDDSANDLLDAAKAFIEARDALLLELDISGIELG